MTENASQYTVSVVGEDESQLTVSVGGENESQLTVSIGDGDSTKLFRRTSRNFRRKLRDGDRINFDSKLSSVILGDASQYTVNVRGVSIGSGDRTNFLRWRRRYLVRLQTE